MSFPHFSSARIQIPGGRLFFLPVIDGGGRGEQGAGVGKFDKKPASLSPWPCLPVESQLSAVEYWTQPLLLLQCQHQVPPIVALSWGLLLPSPLGDGALDTQTLSQVASPHLGLTLASQ